MICEPDDRAKQIARILQTTRNMVFGSPNQDHSFINVLRKEFAILDALPKFPIEAAEVSMLPLSSSLSRTSDT